MKIHYNSPVVLTFAIISIVVFLLSVTIFPGINNAFFSLHGSFSFLNPLDYFRLVSHVIGHANLQHLVSNLMFILLLGPILEEKYGSERLLIVIVLTALVTGILTQIFSSTGLLGASGVVFAFIILVSIVNVQRDSLPLTFILVAFLFLGREILNGLSTDMISQSAHIIGGVVGAYFGFQIARDKEQNTLRY